ncbi:MAG: Multidrug resistance protein MdtA [Alphaproteobacteria bacterium MarineAlpha5_Bin9]|nr:MAG: Multidrug resistance protein MdtA [Alphaproteobacteria bacterium MarineAlpha5_Bin9]|tara:strand:- start:36242 stop:37465 length:1224 start_codon:yes stop_codon:yes gene_type:complete
MRKSLIISFIIIIAVIGWFASGYYSNGSKYSEQAKNNDNSQNKVEETNDDKAIKVESTLSIAQKVDQSIYLQGQTIENRKIEIKSKTAGNIIIKNFKRGQIVRPESLLAQISMEDRKELLSSFEKELKKIKKEILLNKEKKENNSIKVIEQINLYEIEYNSAKELINKGLGSKSKLSLASFNLAQAKSNLKDIELNYESQSVNLESQLENIKSRIKNINIDINNTNIYPPFTGIIEKNYVEIGDFVRQGDILFNIVDLNPIKIQGYLSENDVNKVKLGTKTNIEINSINKIGEVTFISPVAEVNTRTFEFIIEANNDDLSFKSGLTASIIINIESVQAHKIPPSILSLDDEGTVGIKAIENNKVVFFPTKRIKDTIDGMWVSGLPREVIIITAGQEYVTVGQNIKYN